MSVRRLGDPISRRVARPLGWYLPGGNYSDKVLGYSPIAYWPLYETSGTTAVCLVNSPLQDGTYSSDVSGWPVGTGIGDGNTAPGFDGTNDYVDVQTGTLAAALDPDEFTINGWMKANAAAIWGDGSSRHPFFFRADVNNSLWLEKQADAELQWTTRAGGAWDTCKDDCSGFVDRWYPFACTRSKTDDNVKIYVDGVQWGLTAAGLGAWAGAVAISFIGCKGAAPQAFWHGWLAHCAIWDTPLPQATITDLATV